MARPSRQIVLTLVGGAVLLLAMLPQWDQLTWDIFLVLLVPFLILGLVRVRPTLHWLLFAVIVAASVVTLNRIEESESSTAGFGLVVVPLLLTVAVLLAAVIDRSSKRRRDGGSADADDPWVS
jgi:peptidoglycan/LPS O-acetylase OafA/YrhL